MALTGNQLLTGFSKFVDDSFSSTTTSAGNSTFTTLVDTRLKEYGDNRLVGWYVRITESTCINQVSRITGNVQSTGTVTFSPALTAQIASGIDYELHKYDPRSKFQALDTARFTVIDTVFRLVYDETITTDGRSREFSIPSTIRRGPALVFLERPNVSALVNWNFIPEPQCNEVMADWTASNATLATYARNGNDRLVPKYGDACTRISVAGGVNGTVTLAVASMANGVTAAAAAGLYVTYAHWIYCRTASRVTLKLLDDTGTVATSSTHQGKGWELLNVSGAISPTNATTLSVRIDISSSAAAVTAFANNSWFYYGDFGAVNSSFYDSKPIRVRRDATTQKFFMTSPPTERLQLRLVGKELLTALGTNTTTQTTNTMEVDEATAEILYAEAAEVLFQLERLATANLPQVVEKIKAVRDRAKKLEPLWEYDMPEQRVVSPFMQ